MPPVKTVASSADVDTEATAELPVLDVAAYEATLNDKIANTDTWVSPSAVPAPAIVEEGPVPVDADAIPTLRAADSAAKELKQGNSDSHRRPPADSASSRGIGFQPVISSRYSPTGWKPNPRCAWFRFAQQDVYYGFIPLLDGPTFAGSSFSMAEINSGN